MPAPQTKPLSPLQARAAKIAAEHQACLHAVKRATPHHKGHHLHGEEVRAHNDLGQLVVTPLGAARQLLADHPELGAPLPELDDHDEFETEDEAQAETDAAPSA